MPNGNVTILKDNKIISVDQDSLTLGTLIVLQTGDLVPADLIMEKASSLEVDEFDLTGEIFPVKKQAGVDGAGVFMGSRVLKGSGIGRVIAVGDQTEFGNVLKQSWEKETARAYFKFKPAHLLPVGLIIPPLVYGLITGQPFLLTVLIGGILSLFLLLAQNNDLFLKIVTEFESKQLAKQNILLRDKRALEDLGGVQVICFDKTGVLTSRRMQVTEVFLVEGKITEWRRDDGGVTDTITRACGLCHDVAFFERRESANSVDDALISFAIEQGIDVPGLMNRSKRIYELPFDSEKRYMVRGYEIDGKITYFSKGDPAVLLGKCARYLTKDGQKRNVDRFFWQNTQTAIEKITGDGNTVIALVSAEADHSNPPSRYTFLCFLSLGARLLPNIRQTLNWILSKNIRTVMLTGDRPETAIKIGLESGLSRNSRLCLTGNSINHMALDDIGDQTEYCSLFARLIPSQKGILVRVMQKRGHRVAMIGDGFNDGIALKVADVGISFHSNSSDMARKLSKILLNDVNDVATVIRHAYRVSRTTRMLKLVRYAIICLAILVLYCHYFL